MLITLPKDKRTPFSNIYEAVSNIISNLIELIRVHDHSKAINDHQFV